MFLHQLVLTTNNTQSHLFYEVLSRILFREPTI